MFLRVISFLTLLMLSPIYVSAAETANSWEAAIIDSESGIGEGDSYFNLDAEPGEFLSLDILVSNHQDEPLEIEVEKANAFTAPEGGIVYDRELNGAVLLEEEAYLANFMEMDEKLTIPGGSTEILHIHIKVPETAEGTLLGGVKLIRPGSSEENVSETANKKGANFFSGNEQEKSIAIKIDLPEGAGKAGFSIGKIAFDSTNSQISVEMVNAAKEIQGNVKGSYSLMDLEGNEVFSGVIDPFVMAPSSKMNFPVALSSEQLEAGSYTLMVKGKAGEKEFFSEETFPLSESNGSTNTEVSSSGPAIAVIVKYILWTLVACGVIFGVILTIAGSKGKNIKFGRRVNS